MLHYILIVILMMANAILSVHLGLSSAVSKIVVKIMCCPKCLTFWSSLLFLMCTGCNIVVAVLLSLCSAYVSNWLTLLLVKLNKEYNELWQKLSNE